MSGIRQVPIVRSPYPSVSVKNASFTLGTETSNTRNVAIQFKSPRYKSLTARTAIRGYLAADANGSALHATSPDSLIAGAAGSVNAGSGDGGPGLLVAGGLAIDAVATKFKTTATTKYMVGGAIASKNATTAIVFSAAHVISASKFGVILIQIDAAGTISTKVPLATQAYTSAPLALAALPQPDAGKVALGYIAIATGVGAWTANTTDMTNASGVTTATFNDAGVMGCSRSFIVISDATGLVNLIVGTAAVLTYYVALIMPDGTLVVSPALAFA